MKPLFRPRGAVSNPVGRFESLETVYEDQEVLQEQDRQQTTIRPIQIRTIINKNDSPDVPFEYSINPYKGCEHGCIYCFARPTHEYLGLSSGLDFETQVFSKPNAAEVLKKQFSKPRYKCQIIVLGANTDPYQPIERELKITRSILEIMLKFQHPVSLITKSNQVLRDLDLLKALAKNQLVHVNLSVTSLSSELARRMEPRASQPQRRLEAIAELSAANVPVGVLASPMIPALNDMELEKILEAAAKAGAKWAAYILVRLPYEIKNLFSDWLEKNYPDKKKHVLNLIRETRGGKLYQNEWGKRMKGQGEYASLLQERFELVVKRLGLNQHKFELCTEKFKNFQKRQQELF